MAPLNPVTLCRQMSATEAAYLAGLFDGEGCLTTSLNGKQRNGREDTPITVGLIFVVINTHRGVLEWCAKTTGCGLIIRVKSTLANTRRLPCFRFNVGSAGALMELLPQLQPYLQVKSKQAAAAMAFLQSRSRRFPRAAFNAEEVDLVFDLRLANQKSYNLGSNEHILYKKQKYTREEFRHLILSGRHGSIYHVVEWTPEMDGQVGTDIDRVVAERLGLKIAQVQRRREALGKHPFGAVTPEDIRKIQCLRAAGHTIEKTASLVGVSRTTVQRVASQGNLDG